MNSHDRNAMAIMRATLTSSNSGYVEMPPQWSGTLVPRVSSLSGSLSFDNPYKIFDDSASVESVSRPLPSFMSQAYQRSMMTGAAGDVDLSSMIASVHGSRPILLSEHQQSISSLPWAAVAARRQQLDQLQASAVAEARHHQLEQMVSSLSMRLPYNATGLAGLPAKHIMSNMDTLDQAKSSSVWSAPTPPSQSRGKPKASFPMKLLDALMKAEQEEARSSFHQKPSFAWLNGGIGFIVLEHDIFTKHVIQEYGLMGRSSKANYLSFVRKMNRWGFTRSTCSTGQSFHHPLFRQGRMGLAEQIQEKKHNSPAA